MIHQRPSSRPRLSSNIPRVMKRVKGWVIRPQASFLCALILGVAILGACGQREGDSAAPEPGPTNTATSLPAVETYTPEPPPATNTPPPLPTVEATATPTPMVEVTDTPPAAIEPPASDASVTVLGEMNVRSGPGEEYNRIGGATEGEEFDITGKSEDGDWWQIDFDGEIGWIYAPFVTATNAENVSVVGDSMSETPTSETETVAPETEGATVTVLGDMNVRGGPGTDYDRLGGATEGEVFEVSGKSPDGEWWRIDFDGQPGWIYAPYVTAANVEDAPIISDSQTESTAPEDSTTEAPATPAEPLAVAAGDLNVREGPGTEYDRIGGAYEGEEFAITGKSSDGEWWQIDFEGQSGWIYAPFVTATNAENVPVVQPGTEGSTPADSGRRTAIAFRSDGDVLGPHFEEE